MDICSQVIGKTNQNCTFHRMIKKNTCNTVLCKYIYVNNHSALYTMQMLDMPLYFADTVAVTIVIPESTTAAPTTTTDRHVTFLEDPKNIAWLSAAVVILCGIVCLMVYQSFRFGDYSRLARWCQRSRLDM